mgnify:CR=1 FL=1
MGPLELNYVDIQKLLNQNKANITFSVKPSIPSLPEQLWTNLLTPTSSLFAIQTAYYFNGLLTLTVSYNSSLDSQQLGITPTNLSSRSLQLPSDTTFIAKTDGGVPALYFDTNQQSWNFVEWLGMIIDVLYWLVFLLAMYNSKIIGA